MKIQFDGHQEYQIDAINSTLDLFEGQPLAQSDYEIRFDTMTGELFSELGVGNRLLLDDETLIANVRRVQQRNGITPAGSLAGRNFSVEMETGTGKTYVYLRTIYELNARYGYKKFIIVVPSVAIREGVLENIKLTREHFNTLYGNVPLDAWVYDSAQVSRLRQFASGNGMQLLVINIDAFNKKEIAVIHKEQDRLSGRKPIEFIQATNPVVIIDEPQNMETETARQAIASLNPLFTLRYSATHRDLYNLVYRLDPVTAYDLRLVKRIEVDSVIEETDFNQPYIRVQSIKATKAKITAKLEIDVNGKKGPSRKAISISRNGTDLQELSGGREKYQGYIVDHIDAANNYIAFTNGVTLSEAETHGGRTDDVMRLQIRETVKEHLEKELSIARLPEGQRLKVLSLFFIDRVAHYMEEDGKIRRWFIEAYEELSKQARYQALNPLPVEKVHNGYFAQDKGRARDSAEGRTTRADDEAYVLIMQHKERLLSLDESLRFIFSHSALREGWDNPNVFQICTLNETRSEMKKRQEIGRGLRLPVRESGLRSFDPNINRLTIIANESYQEFAGALQTEMEKECGVNFEGRINNKRERHTAQLKKNWRLDQDFIELWNRIKHKTSYSVNFSTADLITRAAADLRSLPRIEAPKFRIEKGEVKASKDGLTTELRAARTEAIKEYETSIPDLLSYLQRETELTRSTIAEILIRSGRLGEVAANPQQFLDQALAAIKKALHELMVAGIKYERIAGAEYELILFKEKELESYLSRLVKVEKSIYDVVEFDSKVERQFAETLNSRSDIKLFIKLPAWFKIDTPLGSYNPDWAIVKEADEKIYLVRETKGTTDLFDLPESQRQKILCGKAHFDALDDVDYHWVASANEV
ncbi:MAG: type restriction enzyme [Blastocatellia bacterium]|nr:type restriction enzyme [Blastocatellia bacterium]